MNTKPSPKQPVKFDNPSGGCGMGCMSIGCLGITLVVIAVCVGGYYSVFHSSLPLKLIESAIEESGDAEIDGLEGTLSTGFSADEFRFRSTDDRWSKLTGIKFAYDSNSSFFGTDELVIKELSVEGGTIYADWDPEDQEFELDPDFEEEFAEINEEFEEVGEELNEEIGHSLGMAELRIENVSIANLRIINTEHDLEITIDQISYQDFVLTDGAIESLGELLVRSSQLDVETVPTIEFPDIANAQRLEGTFRSEVDNRLHQDVAFSFDFGVDEKFKVSSQLVLFDEQVEINHLPGDINLKYHNFQPSAFVELKDSTPLPSNINLNIGFYSDEKKPTKGPTSIESDGQIDMGVTTFSTPRLELDESSRNLIAMDASVDGSDVQLTFWIDSPYSAWQDVQLKSDGAKADAELWAKTLFGKSNEQLNDNEKAVVQQAVQNADNATAVEESPAKADQENVGEDDDSTSDGDNVDHSDESSNDETAPATTNG